MERNYKAVKHPNGSEDWVVEYESYRNISEKWVKSLFKDYLGDVLMFATKSGAEDWIRTRISLT